MKLALLASLFLCGCTHVDVQKGTLFTMGDSTKFKAKWSKGQMTSLEWDSNLHTPIAKSIGHTALGLGAEAVAFGAGGPVVGAGTSAVTSFVNRPTNRTTPVPK